MLAPLVFVEHRLGLVRRARLRASHVKKLFGCPDYEVGNGRAYLIFSPITIGPCLGLLIVLVLCLIVVNVIV